MSPRRPARRRPTINWQALTFAFAVLVSIITAAAFFGGAQRTIQDHERRLDRLEQRAK